MQSIVAEYLRIASANPLSDSEAQSLVSELLLLEDLIPVTSHGFRGVVLTAIVGMRLDPSYRPTEDFYACHPRAIFEQGIYPILTVANIPCGKSDPLNVAKNIRRLDDMWVRGKRPESAARAVVLFLKMLESADAQRQQLLEHAFFVRLHEYGRQINRPLATAFEPVVGAFIPLQIANQLAAFAIECPESGAIPQFIVANLYQQVRSGTDPTVFVRGVDDSVFCTNTTAKKPADIWEVRDDGSFGELIEITVKPIDHKRLDDCADTLRLFNTPQQVTFICDPSAQSNEIAADMHLNYRNICFQFLDIRAFIRHMFCILRHDLQRSFMAKLHAFISHPTRSLRTKVYWENKFMMIRPTIWPGSSHRNVKT